MNLSDQSKKELLSLAAGDADQQSREKMRQLIKENDDYRAYWEALSELDKTIANDANRTEPSLPLGFHRRLQEQLSTETSAPKEGLRHLVCYWKPAFSAAFIITLLAILSYQLSLPLKNPPPSIKAPPPQSHPDSWAALRLESNDINNLSVASNSTAHTDRIPTMNWADRDKWIKEFDL